MCLGKSEPAAQTNRSFGLFTTSEVCFASLVAGGNLKMFTEFGCLHPSNRPSELGRFFLPSLEDPTIPSEPLHSRAPVPEPAEPPKTKRQEVNATTPAPSIPAKRAPPEMARPQANFPADFVNIFLRNFVTFQITTFTIVHVSSWYYDFFSNI